jgi:uncharacterized protein YndB with AHSA1/START domain
MKVIHHVVDIDAEREVVWDAITTRAGLAAWWTTEVAAPPAAVGASIRFTFGGDFNPVMQITKLDAGRSVEWKCIDGHAPWADNTFAFGLEHAEKHTRLRFTQHYATELSDDEYGVYNFNWGYYLNSLGDYCKTGKGAPFDPAVSKV